MTNGTFSSPLDAKVDVPGGQGVQIGNYNEQTNRFTYIENLHLDIPSVSKPAYRETLRVIRGRTGVLLDRDIELAKLVAFATGKNIFGATNYLWLVGGAWAGKTALLAEAVQVIPDTAKKIDIVAYFLVGRESQASHEQFLAVITAQLASLLKINQPSTVDIHVYRDLWARAVIRARQKKRRLLLIVDGLDEDLRPGGNSVAALLPTEHLGRCARVLVASRPHPEIPDDVDAHHPLRTTAAVSLADSPHAAKLKILAQQEINALLSSESANPSAADLPFIVLGLLAAAAGGLTVRDIVKMSSINRHTIRAFITNRAARSLQQMGSSTIAGESRYQFAHQTLLEYCQAHPDVGRDPQYREMIYAWADGWCAKNWPIADMADEQTPSYLLDSYPAILAADQDGPVWRRPDPHRLADLVSDVGWVDAAIAHGGAELVVAALRFANRLVPDRESVAAMLRVVELPEHQWGRSLGTHSGLAVAKLARGASRIGFNELAYAARVRLGQHTPPYLVPIWTDGHSTRHQSNSRRRHDGAVRAIIFSRDGHLVSAGSVDGAIRIWDPASPGDPGRELGRHKGVVLALTVMADGFIASSGVDGAIRIWDPTTPGDPGRELGRHKGAARALAASADGHLVSGGEDGTVRLWDPATPEEPGRILGRHEGQVRGVAMAGDGLIVSGGVDGVVRLWDPATPEDPGREVGRHGAVMALAVIDYRQIVSVGLSGEVRLWEPADPCAARHALNCRSAARAVAATADGRIICGYADGTLRLWESDARGDRGHPVGTYRGAIWALAISEDGRVAAANDNVLTIFSLAS